MTIDNILASLLVPHIFAAALLFKIATLEVRATSGATMRENLSLLWCWYRPHWYKMVIHPLYWAGCAIVTAFFFVGSLEGII